MCSILNVLIYNSTYGTISHINYSETTPIAKPQLILHFPSNIVLLLGVIERRGIVTNW